MHELWQLLRAEGEVLAYSFTSTQINHNFAAGWQGRHDHLDKDMSFQYCGSLGSFQGGEGEQPFYSMTEGVWQKMDGRHTHWVEPYDGIRYSLVIFLLRRQASAGLLPFP